MSGSRAVPREAERSATAQPPLAGIRVLDIATLGAGPLRRAWPTSGPT